MEINTSSTLTSAVTSTSAAVTSAASIVEERTKSSLYIDTISKCYDTNAQITGTNVIVNGQHGQRGKVRDRFDPNISSDPDTTTTTTTTTGNTSNNNTTNIIALVTTDRQSGFDRQLAVVPYKGCVLNLCSAYWFNATSDIIKNHLVSTPHPNISIVKQCTPFPIEFIVRAYLTGSTSTSIWKNYENGIRNYCGHVLPDGLQKNMCLLDLFNNKPILTPTTKEEDHDRPISYNDIITENWMSPSDLDICATAAIALFQRGQHICKQHGLLLVDTKYEFGKCTTTGEILLIDEIHTPDSSRYWIESTYEQNFNNNIEPDNIDKEFVRLWFTKNCNPYTDTILPEAPRELIIELSRRYIQLYEMITGTEFNFHTTDENNSNSEHTISQIIEKEFAKIQSTTSTTEAAEATTTTK